MRLARAAQALTYNTIPGSNTRSLQPLSRSTCLVRTLQALSNGSPTAKQHARTPSSSAITMASSDTAAVQLETVFVRKQFGGSNKRYKFSSSTLGCPTTFTVFFPPAAEAGTAVPVLFFLSGLECSDTNFIEKAGAQRRAAELGLALVTMDTSPRGLGVEGESDSWDFGVGAGFYVNATQDKWKNWQMFDFVTKELLAVLQSAFPTTLDLTRCSISGHSMGGHGALVLALRNPGKFKSVSAFAPICNPSEVPWGIKAFTGYLGEDKKAWREYDAVNLIQDYSSATPPPPMMVDTGSSDPFVTSQLRPDALEAAAKEKGFPLQSRLCDGYDHSYYFISTFVEEHINFHAKALGV